MSKNVDVELPWRHVIAFLSKAETVYSFSTEQKDLSSQNNLQSSG